MLFCLATEYVIGGFITLGGAVGTLFWMIIGRNKDDLEDLKLCRQAREQDQALRQQHEIRLVECETDRKSIRRDLDQTRDDVSRLKKKLMERDPRDSL